MKVFHKMIQKPFPAILLLAVMLLSGTAVQTLYADGQTAAIRAGKFWCGVVDDGGIATFEFSSYSWFPADYNTMGPTMQDGTSQTGSGYVMGATNWTDPLGNVIPKAAILWSPDSDYNWGQMVTVPMTNYTRWPLPLNYTLQSGDTEVENKQVEDWGNPDASKMIGTSDQVIEVTTLNEMGVEIHRKIFAWSQQNHDNYIVVDVTLTNKSGKTLTDFYFNQHQADYYMVKAQGRHPSISDITAQDAGRYTWQHYYGARPGDSLRVFYMYHADNPELAGDQMGLPVYNQDGRLFEKDLHFYTILHASEQPYTNEAGDVDDWLQPRITDVYSRPLVGLTEVYAKTNADRPKLYDYLSGYSATINPMEGTFEGTFHQKPNDEFGSESWDSELPGLGRASTFHARYATFGPYQFGDGEKLHFVYASGYAGLSLEKAKEIGEKWLAGTLEEPPDLPDASTGYYPGNFAFPTADENNNRKNRWLSTGIDSVMASVSRIKWNYEHDWQVPMAPEPPHMWIQGTGEGTEIRWAAPEAEAMDGFYGYRIMRRNSIQDTVFYEEVQRFTADMLAAEQVEIGETTFENGHVFIDTDVLWGGSYYYYVQSGVQVDANDPNAYPGTGGDILWSGRVYSTSRLEVSPERPVGSELDDIRIVPNPYYISDDKLPPYVQSANDPRHIMFFNLPPACIIKLFTESGDLIKTIRHEPLSKSGYYEWNMLTDNQQAISSGIYIAVFEALNGGGVAYQKFIVVR
ncbi:hypothetical protein JW948_05535 [bacterium]|nr:hypothetical protein [bacterium]